LIYENSNDFTKAKDNFGKAAQGSLDLRIRNLATAHSAQIAKLESYRSRLNKGIKPPAADTTAAAKADSLAKSDTTGKTDTTGTTSNPAPAQVSGNPTGQSAPLLFKDIPISQTPIIQPESLMVLDSLRWLKLQDSLAQTPIPGAQPDTSGKNSNILQTLPAPLVADTAAAKDSTGKEATNLTSTSADTSTADEDASIRFLLAELYHHELNRPDSALNEYLLLAEHYPQSTYAPKALLAAAFIYEAKKDTLAAKSLYNKIVALYPTTLQAKFAANHADSSTIEPEKDVFALYDLAEDMYFKDNIPDSAVTLFTFIEKTFPSTEFAPKSAFAKAWILGQTLRSDGDSSAYYAYQDVLTKYPGTPYAEQAKIRLGLVKDATSSMANIDTLMIAAPDSALLDSLARTLNDSLSNMAMDIPMAPPVRDTGAFLFPGSLLTKNLKGRVTFKIRLDPFGKVADYLILGPSGESAIDSAAIAALQATTFDMSQITDLSRLNSYFRYEIKFATPKLNEFYNPYQQREEKGP
jgi:TonB family protein